MPFFFVKYWTVSLLQGTKNIQMKQCEKWKSVFGETAYNFLTCAMCVGSKHGFILRGHMVKRVGSNMPNDDQFTLLPPAVTPTSVASTTRPWSCRTSARSTWGKPNTPFSLWVMEYFVMLLSGSFPQSVRIKAYLGHLGGFFYHKRKKKALCDSFTSVGKKMQVWQKCRWVVNWVTWWVSLLMCVFEHVIETRIIMKAFCLFICNLSNCILTVKWICW